MTLSISILLALVVFLLLISKILPPTSTVIPLIAKYLLFTFIMNIITIFCTVVIINYNYRTPRTNKMPYWMRRVFIDILPRILRMERPNKYDKGHEEVEPDDDDDDVVARNERAKATTADYIRATRTLSINSPLANHHSSSLVSSEPANDVDHLLSQEIYEAAEDLSFIANQMRSACRYEEVTAPLRARTSIRFLCASRFATTGSTSPR